MSKSYEEMVQDEMRELAKAEAKRRIGVGPVPVPPPPSVPSPRPMPVLSPLSVLPIVKRRIKSPRGYFLMLAPRSEYSEAILRGATPPSKVTTTYLKVRELLQSGPAPRSEVTRVLQTPEMSYGDISGHLSRMIDKKLIVAIAPPTEPK